MCAGQKDSLKNGARCSCPHCSARHRTHTECGFLPYLARSAYASNWNSSPGCAYDCGVFSATCIHIYAALCKCFALQLQSTAVSRLANNHNTPQNTRCESLLQNTQWSHAVSCCATTPQSTSKSSFLCQQWPVPSNGAYGSISGNSGDLGL